jgi:hypothetical protein
MPNVTKPAETTVPTDPKELRKILERAQKGDESTLPVLHEMLKAPRWLEACGNLAKHAENALTRKFAGKDLAVTEGLRQKLEVMRSELAGPNPSLLERLLAERIAACWLHVYQLEAVYASRDSLPLDVAMHYQKCIDRAHKRYLSAIKTLATVRKLALPVLQVNIAHKQVNVAGPCLPADGAKEVV